MRGRGIEMIIRSGCQSWNGNPEANLFGYAIEGGRSGERNAIRANATHVAYVRKAALHYYVVTALRCLRARYMAQCTAVCRIQPWDTRTAYTADRR